MKLKTKKKIGVVVIFVSAGVCVWFYGVVIKWLFFQVYAVIY